MLAHKADMLNASANVRFQGIADLASRSANSLVHGLVAFAKPPVCAKRVVCGVQHINRREALDRI